MSITEKVIEAIESDDKEYVLVLVTRILNNVSELESDLMEIRNILNDYYGELIEV